MLAGSAMRSVGGQDVTSTHADVGIYPEFNAQVRTESPPWLADLQRVQVGPTATQGAAYASHGTAIALTSKIEVRVADLGADDVDGDGIPNQIDVLLGAKKADLNDAQYQSVYRKLQYPGGDVPRNEGVCTDVIVRALRNAGIDLQKEVHQDIKRRPRAFSMVKRANPNIDHRRVKTIFPYFKRHWTSLPVTFKGHEETWIPGDIVFMQTMDDERPDHIGIVSDQLGPSGSPLIINNWTNGYKTDALDLLPAVPVTHRFRWKSSPPMPTQHRGLTGVLHQKELSLPPDAKQVVLVTASSGGSPTAMLRLLEQTRRGWRVVIGPERVALGKMGLKAGIGISAPATTASKREGDLSSPAGVFKLGKAFGSDSPAGLRWPYQPVKAGDRWVDDPSSAHYNRWVSDSVTPDWNSAEDLTQYDLAIVIEHNTSSPRKGYGSAIFLHTTEDTTTPTLGCTALPKAKLVHVLKRLRPNKHPVLVQTPAVWFD